MNARPHDYESYLNYVITLYYNALRFFILEKEKDFDANPSLVRNFIFITNFTNCYHIDSIPVFWSAWLVATFSYERTDTTPAIQNARQGLSTALSLC